MSHRVTLRAASHFGPALLALLVFVQAAGCAMEARGAPEPAMASPGGVERARDCHHESRDVPIGAPQPAAPASDACDEHCRLAATGVREAGASMPDPAIWVLAVFAPATLRASAALDSCGQGGGAIEPSVPKSLLLSIRSLRL